MGAGKSSEIRGALGVASSGSLSICLFIPPFTLLPANQPSHPPIYSSTLFLALLDSLSLLPQLSVLICGFLTLHVFSSPPLLLQTNKFCPLMPSVCRGPYQFHLSCFCCQQFVSLFRFRRAGSLLIIFCAMSTLPVFSSARGCWCTEQVLV